MKFGSLRIVMASVFVAVGAAFVVPTLCLMWEFGAERWFDLAAIESSQLLYFPTFGLVALIAFFLPSCIFADLYWRDLRWGRFRLLITFIIGAAVAGWIASLLTAGSRSYSLVELLPKAFDSKFAGKEDGDNPGLALSPAEILRNVRYLSKTRVGLADFIHDCSIDPFKHQSSAGDQKRFCIVSTQLPTNSKQLATLVAPKDCCQMQEAALSAILKLKNEHSGQSIAGAVAELVLPVRVFFFGMMILVTIHLGLRRNELLRYDSLMEEVELRIVVGLVAMMTFLVMAYSQVQTEQAMFGRGHRSSLEVLLPYFTVAFLAAGLFVALFFYNMHNQELERMGKIVGVVSTGVAYVKFDELIALTVRGVGSGIALSSFMLMVCLSLFFSALLLLKPAWTRVLQMQSRKAPNE